MQRPTKRNGMISVTLLFALIICFKSTKISLYI